MKLIDRWRTGALALAIAVAVFALALALPSAPASAAVTISSVSAQWQGGNQVVVTWKTETELDNYGFNVLRSASTDEDPITLNPSIILSDCGGQVCGSTYIYTDTTVSPNLAYWYTIQSINRRGTPENNDPAICASGGTASCEPPTATPTLTPTATETEPPLIQDTATATSRPGSSGSIIFAPTATPSQPASAATSAGFPTPAAPTAASNDSGNVTRIANTQAASTSQPAATSAGQTSGGEQPTAQPASALSIQPTESNVMAAPSAQPSATPLAVAGVGTQFAFAPATLAATPTFVPVEGVQVPVPVTNPPAGPGPLNFWLLSASIGALVILGLGYFVWQRARR